MKRLLPGRVELMVFLAVAVLATGIVALAPKHDLGLALLAMPVFVGAAVMGLKKNWAMMDAEEGAKMAASDAVSDGEQAAA